MESLAAHPPAQIVPAQLGQHQIENHQFRRMVAHCPVSRLPVSRGHDFVRFELEIVPQAAQNGGIVLDNEYPAHENYRAAVCLGSKFSRIQIPSDARPSAISFRPSGLTRSAPRSLGILGKSPIRSGWPPAVETRNRL